MKLLTPDDSNCKTKKPLKIPKLKQTKKKNQNPRQSEKNRYSLEKLLP